MVDKVNILIVDDDENDALLIMRTIRQSGLLSETRHAINETQLRAALTSSWDIVISDHNMPKLSSSDVIKIVKSTYPDVPVIIVSGTMADEIGVEAMQEGAQDYVMKDNLGRLIPAIQREVNATESRKARQVAEQDLQFLAYHDTLTRLINRQEFERRLRECAERKDGGSNILMYLDLDQFKIVNDTCGHVAGDELLKQVTKTLQQHIREEDTLARLGGDEFGLLLEKTSKKSAQKLAERIRKAIHSLRFVWQQTPYSISISIGLVAIEEHTRPIAELLSCADIACYVAKEKGREGLQWYSEDNEEYHHRRNEMQWVGKIKQSLQDDKFTLFFQQMKQLSAGNDGEYGEFLIRLNDSNGLIAPGAFIPAAEKYNLMPQIDRWVVKNVFKYLAETGLGRQNQGTFFINLSGITLSDPKFFGDIRNLLKTYQIKPDRICLEITETAAIDNLTNAVEFIAEIRDEGFKFAIDDFGVGMSSFSYLKTIPVDFLKIDGSFVRNLLNDPIDRGIVEACNQVSHAAGLKTIAEFVENDQIEAALKSIGIDYAQGFGISKPGPLKR